MTAYPKRPRCFAIHFVRELCERHVAQQLGADACWLLTVVVNKEDDLHCTRPVEFWNSELMVVLGFRSPKQLNDVRKLCVDHGWLVYDRKGTRAVGVYFVTIPEKVIHSADGTNSPSIHSTGGTNSHPDENPIYSAGGTENGTNKGLIHSAGGKPSSLPSNPNSKEGKNRKGKSKPKQSELSLDRAPGWEHHADKLLARIGAPTELDKRLLASVAWLLARGELSEAKVWSAVDAVTLGETPPENPLGYFRTCLNNSVGEGKLKSLLATVPTKLERAKVTIDRPREFVNRIDEAEGARQAERERIQNELLLEAMDAIAEVAR